MAGDRNPNSRLKGPCEAGLSYKTGPGAAIYGVKCERPGRWRPTGLMPYGTILCDDCYVSILLKQRGDVDD